MLVSASVKHVLGSAYTVAVPLAILATKSDIWRVTRAVNTCIIMINDTNNIANTFCQIYRRGGTIQSKKFQMTAEQIQRELGLGVQ